VTKPVPPHAVGPGGFWSWGRAKKGNPDGIYLLNFELWDEVFLVKHSNGTIPHFGLGYLDVSCRHYSKTLRTDCP